MDYKIVETWIDNDKLCCHVLINDASGVEELITVPVKTPRDKQAVLDAIVLRCRAEMAKRDYVAQITPIKTEVDAATDVVVVVE